MGGSVRCRTNRDPPDSSEEDVQAAGLAVVIQDQGRFAVKSSNRPVPLSNNKSHKTSDLKVLGRDEVNCLEPSHMLERKITLVVCT